ncbi:mechanosensitive ion channel [Orbus wheelerorum]|uniref:mechanosensitive ion channel family protein n=1 Tax=Orbus wheelerorum TaxID=3074111 RepID=UPI00370D68A1
MQNYLIKLLNQYNVQFSQYIALGLILCLIIFIAVIVHLVVHRILLKNFSHNHTGKNWGRYFIEHKVFNRLAYVLQGLLVYMQARLWLNDDELLQEILIVASQIWILISITLSLFSFLDTGLSISQRNGLVKRLPIRGVIQSIKIIMSILMTILTISLLIDRSPLLLLSGLGAMTAVLMLIFKDPLLGLVAGIQLSANKMLNVGDWLEMPKYGADGDVIDINLTTVKVQNWDKTITTIPTYALISDSFKNWQGMTDSGSRRIKRSIYIDTTSVHFLNAKACEKLKKSQLIAPYIEDKLAEITRYNDSNHINVDDEINARRLTNLGTFRAYLEAFIRNNPQINKEMTLMVRQLSPTSNGLPLEIYAFTNTTQWAVYENIQADIFDHIFAIISEFGLRIHQTPTGYDIGKLGSALKH